ncbi:MAG: A/G-specific adenine glycosylase [Chitinophagaceae bacterium]
MYEENSLPDGRFFVTELLKWDRGRAQRIMPWKGEKDVYKIWLSEVILQQTRVEQGLPYYQDFIRMYPDVLSLADAPDEEVFRLWQGLGYYTRCKNLIQTARRIRDNYQGCFPHSYEEILGLPGIGPYTAAAVSSFGFNLPYAVLDGNVFRLLSRFFSIKLPVDSSAGKKFFFQLAQQLLDHQNPAMYNQAIMDFGSLVCKPRQPNCPGCPLKKHCLALAEEKVEVLPVKSKKILSRERYFHYLVLHFQEEIYLQKRTESDIWQNLFEFPLIESPLLQPLAQLRKKADFKKILPASTAWKVLKTSSVYQQQLTHRKILALFFELELSKPLPESEHVFPVRVENLGKYPLPKLIISFLQEKMITLNGR